MSRRILLPQPTLSQNNPILIRVKAGGLFEASVAGFPQIRGVGTTRQMALALVENNLERRMVQRDERTKMFIREM